MSDMIEPLNLLRDYTLHKREITFNNSTVCFGPDLKLPSDVETAWKKSDGSGYYTIGALAFYIVNRDLKPIVYLKKVNDEKYPVLAFNDRKTVLEYFTITASTSD